MKQELLLATLLAGVLATIACAAGPATPEAAPKLPPIAAGEGRIVLYMTSASQVESFHPALTVDGEVVGKLRVGTFRAVGRPAGPHQVGVHVQPSLGAFGNQDPTTPQPVELAAGDTAYVEILVIDNAGIIQVVLHPENAEGAQRAMERLVQAPPGD
jgi:hypothetical protein